jgi:hypothetical protein
MGCKIRRPTFDSIGPPGHEKTWIDGLRRSEQDARVTYQKSQFIFLDPATPVKQIGTSESPEKSGSTSGNGCDRSRLAGSQTFFATIFERVTR